MVQSMLIPRPKYLKRKASAPNTIEKNRLKRASRIHNLKMSTLIDSKWCIIVDEKD